MKNLLIISLIAIILAGCNNTHEVDKVNYNFKDFDSDVTSEFSYEHEQISPSTQKYKYVPLDSNWAGFTMEYYVNFESLEGTSILDDTTNLNYQMSKEYIVDDKTYDIHFFIENEFIVDGTNYVFLNKDFGLVNSRNPSWGSKFILKDINNEKSEILEKLNGMLMQDTLFYLYPFAYFIYDVKEECYDKVFISDPKPNPDTISADDTQLIIENNSSLKAELIYYQNNTNFDFDIPPKFDKIQPIEIRPIPNTSSLVFKTLKDYILIHNDSIIRLIDSTCVYRDALIPSYKSILFDYCSDTTSMTFDLGKVNLTTLENICTDTDLKKAEIITNKNEKLILNQTRNLFIIEGRADYDGSKELYFISYHTCMGRIEIIKVYE